MAIRCQLRRERGVERKPGRDHLVIYQLRRESVAAGSTVARLQDQKLRKVACALRKRSAKGGLAVGSLVYEVSKILCSTPCIVVEPEG